MKLPDFQIDLSSSSIHPTYGATVKFFCLGTGKYETEKHTHDHELYMRKCDADMIRLLISIFYKEIKKYVELRQVRSANALEAIQVLELCRNGLSANGDSGEQLRSIKPYSRNMLFTCCGYLNLALQELDPEPVPDAPHSLTKLYKQLLHLAQKAEQRYEQLIYQDITA